MFFCIVHWRDSGVSLWAELHVSLSSHVGFMPQLPYSGSRHSSEGTIHLKTGWPQDAWLQWSYKKWNSLLDISRWPRNNYVGNYFSGTCHPTHQSCGVRENHCGLVPRPGMPFSVAKRSIYEAEAHVALDNFFTQENWASPCKINRELYHLGSLQTLALKATRD